MTVKAAEQAMDWKVQYCVQQRQIVPKPSSLLLTLCRQSHTRQEVTMVTTYKTLYQGRAGLNWLSSGFLTSVRLSILQQQVQLLMHDHLIVQEILHFRGIKLGIHFINAAATKRIIFEECLLTRY